MRWDLVVCSWDVLMFCDRLWRDLLGWLGPDKGVFEPA